MDPQTEKLYKKFSEITNPAQERISTDSRHIAAGSIFFGLHGERFDGNRFAADALRQGAALSVVDDASAIPADATADERSRYFVVADTLAALQDLARLHRQRLGLPIVAITGTNGKTTTKELTAAVLSKKFRTAATQGNLNNHIGVPLTLLSLHADTEIGIIEMGASARGEIAALCSIAQPDYGIITNIGRAHLEGFGGPEGIRAAKGELYDWLRDHGGTAFVRSDDEVLREMAESRTGLRTTTYTAALADGIACRLEGDYNRYNIAAAAAVGSMFGIDSATIADAIGSYVPSINRSQRIVTEHNTVIADCYNANPSSMQAALEWFSRTPLCELDPAAQGKTVIIGSMLELGEWSLAEHTRIVEQAAGGGFDTIIFTGAEYSEPVQRFLERGQSVAGAVQPTVLLFGDTDEVAEHLQRDHDARRQVVLLKGSRKMALEKILEYL